MLLLCCSNNDLDNSHSSLRDLIYAFTNLGAKARSKRLNKTTTLVSQILCDPIMHL